MRLARPALLTLITAALIWAAAPAAAAGGVRVARGRTVKLALPRQPRIIGVEDPSIARLTLTADGHALVTGLRVGRTRIVGRDFAEVPIIIPVTVFAARSASQVGFR